MLPIAPLAAALLTLVMPAVAPAACDPNGADAADWAAARAAMAGCDCENAPDAATYKRCAKDAARAVLVNRGCLRPVTRCAARSTCGRPGAAVCCRTKASGAVQGIVVRAPEHCRARRGGTACVGAAASVCDACDASGCVTTCGDGVLDEGEQCDGQPYCSAACRVQGVGCCQGEATCRELPVFLSSALLMGCSPDTPVRGTCTAGGTCAHITVAPDTLCCTRPDACDAQPFSTVEQYAGHAYQCFTSGGTPMVGGACGSDGRCHPPLSIEGVWDLAGTPGTEACPGAPAFASVLSLDQTGLSVQGSGFNGTSIALSGTVGTDAFTVLPTGVPGQVPCTAGGVYETLFRLEGTPRPGGAYEVEQRWTLFPLAGGSGCPPCSTTWTGTMTFAFDPFP